MSIEVGDIVKLNSGGPDMTVVKVFDSDDGIRMVEVNWWSRQARPKPLPVAEHFEATTFPEACVFKKR